MKINQIGSDDTAPNPLPTTRVRVWLLLTLLIGLLAASARAADRQFLHNQLPAAVTNAAPLRHFSRWARLNLTIGLPLRDRTGLTNLLQQLYDPASPNFRHFLTPEQFAQRFGPTEEDYQAVVSFAQSHGLVVTGRHPNRTLVNVRGPVAAVQRAFHVTLNEYQHPTEDRTFYAPDVEPSLDLTTPVLSVSGLDNYVVPHPCLRPIPPGQAKADATGSGPGGAYLGNDFRAAYAPGVTLTGAGQIAGILEFDSGYYQSDITAYELLAGLPNVPVSAVLLDGYNGGPGNGNTEASLDVEMAISMAPGLAGVIVYEGSTTDDILNRMATDNLAKQIAASWTYATDANSDQIFLQFAAQGQSFFNASGDGDAYTGAVDPPTDDPNITIVGGTTLTTASAGGAWASETVWNRGGGVGSGGGISTRYAIPTWQQGISMTANQGSTTMRNLPDVALTAENIYVIYGGGQSEGVGGTSCAVQLWSAFTALMNQLAVTNGEPTVGFINPAIYAIGNGSNVLSYTTLFHDTTNGNNEKASSPTRFVAVPGYDLCTGWGTPNGGSLITAVGLPEPLQITPLTVAIFSGPVGGPFAPATQTYTLTNSGPGSLHWSLANTSSWFTVSPMAGTIVEGGPPDTVTVSVTSTAASLPAGSYSAALRFTNLGDNSGQTRQLTLAVVGPPVITAQPTNLALLEGMTATFSVGTGPNALMFYQWQDNGVNVRDEGNYYGATTSTLTISNISGSDQGNYSVILSNAAGVLASSNAVLTYVKSSPVIVLQPVNQIALPGSTASFSVGAVGNTPYSYQWQFNGTNLEKSATYSGVTAQTLTVSNISPADAGTYSVIVGDFLGSTNSSGAVLSVIPVTAPGVSMSPVVSFSGGSSGTAAYSPIAQGTDGNFYGTTVEGGDNSDGTVFKVTTNGALTTLHQFDATDGAVPYGGLCLGKDGFFFGTAASGGTYDEGTLFKITISGLLTTLINFDGNNGAEPVAGLVQGADGNFYGTALEGGDNGYGTIFRMTAGGALTTLVSFNFDDGANPSSALIQGSDGNFYGTTEDGGAYTWGTVFQMTPSGNFTNLYSFTGGSDGGSPVPGLVQGADGNFYGTTYVQGADGFGTVFEITSSGALTTRYSFTGLNDGGNPWGGMVQAADGNLYGTTQDEGAYGFGTVFQIAPTGVLATVGQFDGYTGSYPSAALVQGADGNLYGTTLGGGLDNDGVIYRVSINGPLQITGQPANQSAFTGGTAAFTVATFGAAPVFYQWQQNGINLTNGGGVSGANAATLSITNVTVNDAAVYTVVLP
ncbi:MAG TPA: choice-of-anchor tandem repeat GloVer-containing protein, partial [Candidatus Saccharimonadales bacterium]|nr:choice-of-anchor tandem repeat GloVer-containing protein [Candidatus Saccharimonadales bacterium]